MIHILINPTGAGGRTVKYWKSLEKLFAESGREYQVHMTRSEQDLEEICRKIGAGEDLVIVGGDGTINQAVNGLADPAGVRLGIIPCGSGNDLAKDLSLPAGGRDIVQRILQGQVRRRSDVGIVELLDADGKTL
ncbi:MAG: acylglycerol kinase family protein, partial [Oscillospiraceae bacterium]|nr:acylglycerol kinase family protein [Oscillospiraceae bacterium]